MYRCCINWNRYPVPNGAFLMQVTHVIAWTSVISLTEQNISSQKRKTVSRERVKPFFRKLSRWTSARPGTRGRERASHAYPTDGRTNMLHNYMKALSATRRSGHKIRALVIIEMYDFRTRHSQIALPAASIDIWCLSVRVLHR
jgi:hypothetical protein